MQDSPTFSTAAIVDAIEALPPVSMSYETFCEIAVARVAAVDPTLACFPNASHRPANNNRRPVAYTEYGVQVWTSPDGYTIHTNIIYVHPVNSPEQALHDLGRELAALKAKMDYDATK